VAKLSHLLFPSIGDCARRLVLGGDLRVLGGEEAVEEGLHMATRQALRLWALDLEGKNRTIA